MITYDFNLQLFATIANGANATVASGSMGAIDTSAGGSGVPYAGHSYNAPNNDLSPEMKVFYDKTLLEEAQPNLVHAQFGQKRPIPKNNGKTIEFRKFDSLPKALTPITEGVTPAGRSLRVTAKPATVEQYGDYIKATDVLTLTAFDPIVYESTKLIGQQSGLTLDTLTRDVLQSGNNVLYCPKVSGGSLTPVSSRKDLDGTARLSVRQIKKAVAILRAKNTPTINGNYVAIIHPFAALDIMNDPAWEDIQNYANPENRLAGEIGRIAGVRFVESTEAKIEGVEIDLGGGVFVEPFTVKTAVSGTASTSVTIEETPATATGLSIPVFIDGTANTITAITYGASGSTLTLGTAITVAKGKKITSGDATSDGLPVYCTLVLGQNAYGITEIEGGGLQTIIKPLGSGEDPLNQRCTVGWKAMHCAEILSDAYILRVESSSDEISDSEFDIDEN